MQLSIYHLYILTEASGFRSKDGSSVLSPATYKQVTWNILLNTGLFHP